MARTCRLKCSRPTCRCDPQRAVCECGCCQLRCVVACLGAQSVRTAVHGLAPAVHGVVLSRGGGAAQALFGDCSVVAVAQSIPLTPMEFARLYETTLRQVREDSDDGTLPSPPTTLQTRPACDRLVEDLASNKNYRARVLDAVVGPEDPALANAPAANDTAALVEAMRENGKQRTAVATLAGRPVQYAVCSTDTWDNTLVINTPGNGKDEGGRQLTYIAFLNSCPDYDARVKLDIVPAGASVAVSGLTCAGANMVSAAVGTSMYGECAAGACHRGCCAFRPSGRVLRRA